MKNFGTALGVAGLLVSLNVTADERPADTSSELLMSARVSAAELKDKTLTVVAQDDKDGKKTTVSVVAVRKVTAEETGDLLQKQKKNPDGTVTRCYIERPGAVMREYRLNQYVVGTFDQARAACHNHIVDEGRYYRPAMGIGDVCNWKNLSRYTSDEAYGRWNCCGYTYN